MCTEPLAGGTVLALALRQGCPHDWPALVGAEHQRHGHRLTVRSAHGDRERVGGASAIAYGMYDGLRCRASRAGAGFFSSEVKGVLLLGGRGLIQ